MKTILFFVFFVQSIHATECVEVQERVQPEFVSIRGRNEKYCLSEVRCKENSSAKLHTVVCASKTLNGKVTCPDALECFTESQKILIPAEVEISSRNQ